MTQHTTAAAPLPIANRESSPRRRARFAGFLYLVVILGGAFAEAFVRMRLMVRADTAATAARIPERIDQVVIVSGGWRMDWPEARQHLPLPNRLTLSLARRAPWLLGWMLRAMTAGTPGPREQELAQLAKHVPPADLAAFGVGDRLEVLGRMLREAVRQGPRGAVWDLGLYGRTFDFELSAVRKPLHLFHGEADRNAPLPLVRKVASLLPNAHLTTFPGEAHLSTLVNHFNAIAERL